MVGDMPRASLMEQIISFSPTPVVVAAVGGLERPISGLEAGVVCLFEL